MDSFKFVFEMPENLDDIKTPSKPIQTQHNIACKNKRYTDSDSDSDEEEYKTNNRSSKCESTLFDGDENNDEEVDLNEIYSEPLHIQQ